MSTDPWVAVLRSIAGNDVARTPEEAGWDESPLAHHVVICRESALSGATEWSRSLDGLPDSDNVAHWFDGHLIRTAEEQRRRFDQAVAMAVGLNEWEALQ